MAPFTIDAVTLDGAPVTAYGGLALVPSASADVLASTDLLIVPGSIDLSGPLADRALIGVIVDVARRDDTTVASVCTGAFLLEQAGLLRGIAWTTHWEDIDLLADVLGTGGARRLVRWVDAGDVITGGALSSGLAMALHLVAAWSSTRRGDRQSDRLRLDRILQCCPA